MKKITDAVVLKQGDRRVAVVPEYQGRVKTSTTSAKRGSSFGWLNYYLILTAVLSSFFSMSQAYAEEPAIVSAYLGGLNVWPPALLSNVTGCPQNLGDDAMPVVLSVQVDASTLDAADFRVISRAGVVSTPNCATLRPANEANELHTILLAGPIAVANDLPDQVEIVGDVKDVNGTSLTGLVSPTVTNASEIGTSLVYAYLFDKPGGPSGSSPRAIQLVWQGGVTGPNGAMPGVNQLNAIRVIDCEGIAHTPLGMDDLNDAIVPDNYIELYIPDEVVANRIEVDAGAFFDPFNVPNPATAVEVISLLPPAAGTDLEFDAPDSGTNRIHFMGTKTVPHRIFFSTDLQHWECVGSATADSSSGAFHLDHNRNAAPVGFYRSTP